MRKQTLFLIWGGMFILCGLLGFIPEPEGLIKALMVLSSVCFFIPGAVLLYQGCRYHDRKQIQLLRNLSLISLSATLVLLVLNFLSVTASDAAGDFLYGILVIVSSPMICCQYWFLSLFLWACLLVSSLSALSKEKRQQ